MTKGSVTFGMRMFPALAFVRPQDVQGAFEVVLTCPFVRDNNEVLTRDRREFYPTD